MHQNMGFKYSLLKGSIDENIDPEPLQVNIYTSRYCAYCNEALAITRAAIENLDCDNHQIEIIETTIDDNPKLVEELDILALPMIQIGRVRLIGLPNVDDIERFVHETILMGY